MPVTGDQIRDSLRAVPFKPFRLHLADRRTVEVFHPDFAMVSPNGRVVAVFLRDSPDVCRRIDVLLIVSIEDIEEQPPASQQAA
jgi:hypothetical protein